MLLLCESFHYLLFCFFFNDTATTEIYTLSLHDALPISHTYDLPIHFKGQLIETSFDMAHATARLEPLGSENGYQHLWQRSVSEPLDKLADASWLLGDQFYTLSFKSDLDPTVYFLELGANDPNHNLRHEQALMLRSSGESVTYVSVYERHGRYDSDEEVTDRKSTRLNSSHPSRSRMPSSA